VEYTPRPHFEPFHSRTQRFAVMVAHRRAGKTVACVNELIARAVYNTLHKPRYSYVGPYRNQAKKIAWEYLKDYTQDMADRVSEAELSVRLKHNQAEITIYGADNPNSFRGLYNDGAIIDEYGDMMPSVWAKNLLPTLADRRGWAVFIGTPKGKNHFFKEYMAGIQDPERIFTYMLKASESGILPDSELQIQRSKMTEDEYNQEYECSFDAAVIGTYYASMIGDVEKDGRIDALVDWDEEFPVKISWDLGYTDSTAIWFWQDRPDGLAIIDFEEAHSEPLSYYVHMLQTKPYRYSEMWLPHDARAKTLQTGRSTIEQLVNYQFLGDPRIDIVPNLSIQQGIDAARKMLPKCWFNPRTLPGLEALRAYRRAYDETRNQFSNHPLHDWSSHGSDAFRYLSLVAVPAILSPISREIIVESPRIQLDPLFEDRELRISRRRGRI
jgi:phage terminase large subunit